MVKRNIRNIVIPTNRPTSRSIAQHTLESNKNCNAFSQTCLLYIIWCVFFFFYIFCLGWPHCAAASRPAPSSAVSTVCYWLWCIFCPFLCVCCCCCCRTLAEYQTTFIYIYAKKIYGIITNNWPQPVAKHNRNVHKLNDDAMPKR